MTVVLILAVIFGSIASIFIVPSYFRSREREQQQATIRAAIERGQPLPPELIDAMTRNVRPRPTAANDLRTAIVWLGLGIGIAAFFVVGSYVWANEMLPVATIGAIPGFIGLAFLVMALVGNNKKDRV